MIKWQNLFARSAVGYTTRRKAAPMRALHGELNFPTYPMISSALFAALARTNSQRNNKKRGANLAPL